MWLWRPNLSNRSNDMQEVIEQLRHLSSAEDFLRFFDIAFDEKCRT